MPVEFLAIGRVLRPHGVRGEMLLETLTEFPEHLAEVETVYLGEAREPHPVRQVRFHRTGLLLQLADFLDPDAVERVRGQLVQIQAEAAAPLPEGRYYHHQIIGLKVVTETGEALGEVTEILETGANDVYVVTGPQGEVLLPALKSVILNIDLDSRQLTARLLEGLR